MGVSVWADISAIWLLSLALVGILPFAVLFFFAIMGMRRLTQLARKYLPLAGAQVERVADKTEEISNKIASPVIKTYSTAARVRGMTHEIVRRNDRWTSNRKAS
ncbi:MAG: hypothetical protein JXA93_20045 [Anaerolineae bacterium]|nr:hypothetical protein [Anaerolineae bacterium]